MKDKQNITPVAINAVEHERIRQMIVLNFCRLHPPSTIRPRVHSSAQNAHEPKEEINSDAPSSTVCVIRCAKCSNSAKVKLRSLRPTQTEPIATSYCVYPFRNFSLRFCFLGENFSEMRKAFKWFSFRFASFVPCLVCALQRRWTRVSCTCRFQNDKTNGTDDEENSAEWKHQTFWIY